MLKIQQLPNQPHPQSKLEQPQPLSLTSDYILKKQMTYQKQSKQTLQKTLQFSGLKIGKQIDYRSVKIYDIDHIHQLYSNNEESGLPHIVLLHGFGGTSMTFFRFFKNLRDSYIVHAIDSLGIGHSSKGVFRQNFTYEQARHYFIDAIQQWRKALNIQTMVLLGHSFGGYLAACYTDTYPDRVARLIMLSPAGATEKTPADIQEQLRNRYKNDGIRGKFMSYFAQSVYNMKIRPSKAMNTYVFGSKLIDRIVDVRLKLKLQQRDAWKSYFKDLAKRESTSQIGFYIIFQWPLKTKHTIQSIITNLNFKKPIQFYYGQYDWMDCKGAIRLSQKFQYVKFDKITQADHQLTFDNPDQVCYYILLRRTIWELSLQSQYDAQLRKKKQMGIMEENEEKDRESQVLPKSLVD